MNVLCKKNKQSVRGEREREIKEGDRDIGERERGGGAWSDQEERGREGDKVEQVLWFMYL